MTTTSSSSLQARLVSSKQALIAIFAVVAIVVYLLLRFCFGTSAQIYNLPLWATFLLGGIPLIWDLLRKMFRGEFGSDFLAGLSIVTSVILGEYLAGVLVVLMLSGGEALEAYAVRSASSVLHALAKRMPSVVHRRVDSRIQNVALDDVCVGDVVLVFPHEICPIDGTVIEGHGVMDESYLTGEPYLMSKTPGSAVLSGAINGESALTVRADRRAVDSRYAKIMEVMRSSEQQRPQIRRLADRLGAYYTPLAIALGLMAWLVSQEPVRFLAVIVVATPCPLLIAIPVAVIGSISLSARRAIIIRNPAILETVETCRTLIFDKTGTLTYGKPQLTEQLVVETSSASEVLSLVSSVEQYSKHPLATAITRAGRKEGVVIHEASQISERPGEGLTGLVVQRRVEITSRQRLIESQPEMINRLPEPVGGLECVILIDGRYAATYRFRDTPRRDVASFVNHLHPHHRVTRTMLLSGDRESEVQYLASEVGIQEIHAGKSPEEKLQIVRDETARANTVFVGDGINDAPALMAATVGVAFGHTSDVTVEAADAVVMDSSLQKVDELMHISERMRRIALQSAIGGMALSVVGMLVAAAGYLPPVAGAVTQEIIDVLAVVNALRVALPPKALSDF